MLNTFYAIERTFKWTLSYFRSTSIYTYSFEINRSLGVLQKWFYYVNCIFCRHGQALLMAKIHARALDNALNARGCSTVNTLINGAPHPAHNPDSNGSRIKSDNTVWGTRRTQIGNSHLLLLNPRLIVFRPASLLFSCSLISVATRIWSKSLKIAADFPVACTVIAIDLKAGKINLYISLFHAKGKWFNKNFPKQFYDTLQF